MKKQLYLKKLSNIAAFLYYTCWMRNRTHINGARAGALLAQQIVTRRCVAGGDVQPLQSLQFWDDSLKTYNRTTRTRLNVPSRTSGVSKGVQPL